MVNVLVTGGAGYIGSHACKALSKAGYTPIAYDNLVYGHECAVKWGPLEQGDLNDLQRLDQVLAETGDAVLTVTAAPMQHSAFAEAWAVILDTLRARTNLLFSVFQPDPPELRIVRTAPITAPVAHEARKNSLAVQVAGTAHFISRLPLRIVRQIRVYRTAD